MTGERDDSLRERLRRARRKRNLPPREGHEISAAGREMRTPSRDEFFGNLEKAAEDEPPAETLPHPKHEQDGGI